MDNIENKIDEILSNPKAMATIKSLSDMLLKDNTDINNRNDNANQNNSDNDIGQGLMNALNMITNSQQESNENDNKKARNADKDNKSSINDAFADMQVITKILPLISKLNQDNEHTRFLDALKPLVSKEKQSRVEEAKRMMKLMSVIKP